CSGGLTAMFFIYPRNKVWDCGITVNGFLAGLVAITCPCYWVSPLGALLIGGTAGVVCVLGIDFLEYIRVDDPIGAVPVHGFCGIWGTLSLGLFATGQFGAPTPTGADVSSGALVSGLFYGGGFAQLKGQLIGSVSVTAATFGVALALMYVVKKMGYLRISEAGELEGIDKHEHGGPAYPELLGGVFGTSMRTHDAPEKAPTAIPRTAGSNA
ncbi:MAG: ammonium transporter, partial [Polyangia bacterium]